MNPSHSFNFKTAQLLAIFVLVWSPLTGAAPLRCDVAISEQLKQETRETLLQELAELRVALASLTTTPQKARLIKEFERKLAELTGMMSPAEINRELAIRIRSLNFNATESEVQEVSQKRHQEKEFIRRKEFINTPWDLGEPPMMTEWARKGNLLLVGLNRANKTVIRNFETFEDSLVDGFLKVVDEENGYFITTMGFKTGPTIVYSLKDFSVLFKSQMSFGEYIQDRQLLVTRDGDHAQISDVSRGYESPIFRSDSVTALQIWYEPSSKTFVAFQNATFNQKLTRIQAGPEDLLVGWVKPAGVSSAGYLLSTVAHAENPGAMLTTHWTLFDLRKFDAQSKPLAIIKKYGDASFVAQGELLIEKEHTHSGSSNVFRVYDVKNNGQLLTTFKGLSHFSLPTNQRVTLVRDFNQMLGSLHLVDLMTGQSIKNFGDYQPIQGELGPLVVLRKSGGPNQTGTEAEFIVYDIINQKQFGPFKTKIGQPRLVANDKVLQIESMDQFFFYEVTSGQYLGATPVNGQNRTKIKLAENLKYLSTHDIHGSTIELRELNKLIP